MKGKVFVTVGSTSFDELLSTVCSPKVLETLKSKGYTDITIQTGRGNFVPVESPIMKIHSFTFKENLQGEIKLADLVISHAGAGSILEALENQKPLIVVINDKLMDNHQEELAKEFEENDYLKCCYCNNLADTINNFDTTKIRSYTRAEPGRFLGFFDQIMGYDSDSNMLF